MSNYTLKTITKMNGPLSRFYSVQIFGVSIPQYIQWRRRCGHDYNIDLTVSDDVITSIETYQFDNSSDVDTFMSLILGTDSVAAYNRPWDNLLLAESEAMQVGLNSLVSYKVDSDGSETEVYRI